MTSPLFQPFDLKGLHLPNRVVMAPMTRSFSPGGQPGDNVAAYYRRRAEGEVGLIVTEGTVIERDGAANDPNYPHFWGDALNGWGKVVAETHAGGGRIAPQLWHVGSAINRSVEGGDGTPESPSGLFKPGKPWGRAMTDADIADTIAAFARAAGDAKRLGFDAVELHGAHGYLIDQFFWAGTNARDDAWSGGPAERGRFAAELLKAVRVAVGPEFPVIIRVSQWKQQDYNVKLAATPDALAAWLTPLADAGADMFHCSQRRFWEPEFPEIDGEAGLNFAGWAKKVTGTPTITVGSVGLDGDFIAGFGGEGSQPASLDGLLDRLDRQEFDLVAVGRALIVDPDWVQKVRDGRSSELRGFDRAALATLV